MRLREEWGIDVKISLCDTIGYVVTYPEAALPRSVDKLVRAFIEEAGVLCFTVSVPIVDDNDEIMVIFGIDIQFEDWVKTAEEIDDTN